MHGIKKKKHHELYGCLFAGGAFGSRRCNTIFNFIINTKTRFYVHATHVTVWTRVFKWTSSLNDTWKTNKHCFEQICAKPIFSIVWIPKFDILCVIMREVSFKSSLCFECNSTVAAGLIHNTGNKQNLRIGYNYIVCSHFISLQHEKKKEMVNAGRIPNFLL